MRRHVLPLSLALSLALLTASPSVAGTRARSGSGTWADFNADGYADLYVGVYRDQVNGMDAGAVNVINGAKRGTHPRANQLWHQDRPRIRGAASDDDAFGWAVGAGDFDGDGHDDLAVGIPGEMVNGVPGAGAVQVIYGGRKGLSSRGNQLWHQERKGIADQAEDFDSFGMKVAAGDVDADGYDDLLVGVPFEDLAGFDQAGAMHVIRGGPKGLRSRGSQLWHQGRAGVAGDLADLDGFGFEIAVGQFGRGPQMDVAVTSLDESLPSTVRVGSVHVLFGSRRGLTAKGSQFWHHGRDAIPGEPQEEEGFGMTLAAGDFGRGAMDDLAVSIHAVDVGAVNRAGAVAVLYGGRKGLRSKGVQLWHQDRPGIADQAEDFDGFGMGLAAGDLGRDGRDDLAIGVPLEGLSVNSEGVVHVLFGTKRGLRARGSQYWHQDTPGVREVAEPGDLFGLYMMAGDTGRGPKMDLAIAAVNEGLGSVDFAGVVHVLHGTRRGLTAKGDRLWHQDVPRIKGVAETGDQFGILTRGID